MASASRTPTRRCRGCYRRLPQDQLQRWTLGPGGLEPDGLQRRPGRGAYTCSPECEARLLKTKATTATKL